MRLNLIAIILLFSAAFHAQVPALIPYQAVARDGAGQALVNASITARFSIHDVMIDGAIVWQDVQALTTNAVGLFNAKLGSNAPRLDPFRHTCASSRTTSRAPVLINTTNITASLSAA
jgi:hypothetical protein